MVSSFTIQMTGFHQMTVERARNSKHHSCETAPSCGSGQKIADVFQCGHVWNDALREK